MDEKYIDTSDYVFVKRKSQLHGLNLFSMHSYFKDCKDGFMIAYHWILLI